MFIVFSTILFNPNLGGLLGVCFEVGVKLPPCLKRVRTMLET